MLNLVRFRDKASYPDGREATGAEAYAAYARDSYPVFKRLGGRIAWRGSFELTLIGPADEKWDECFIAEYPSVAAFVEMIRDPVYREAVKRRGQSPSHAQLYCLTALGTRYRTHGPSQGPSASHLLRCGLPSQRSATRRDAGRSEKDARSIRCGS